jgi:hypothetical protein
MRKLQKPLGALTLLAALLAACLGAACGKPAAAPPPTPNPPAMTEQAPGQGKVRRVYSRNTEVQDRFNKYYAARLPALVTVDWVITPTDGNAYQDKLDADLPGNTGSPTPIDLFLIEADYALKYVNSEYTLDVFKDVGLTPGETAGQYAYTQEIATDTAGVLKAVSWQATPGLFAYRRSIAKAVLGTDDPAQVQAALADWDKFDDVAARAAARGYRMLSGFDDAFRVFSNNVSAPWVDAAGNIVIDENIWRWVDQTKVYTDQGYNNRTSLWSEGWATDQGPDGKVFGFFYSTWGINFTLLDNSLAQKSGAHRVGNGIYGDYGVCQGPESWYWGGTWLAAAKGTDNVDLVRDIMRVITCDPVTMRQITVDTEDYTNNRQAMTALAADPAYGSPFLGGQNHIALFADAAPNIDMANISPYDQGLNEAFQTAFADYFRGDVGEAVALRNFNNAAQRKYPALKAAKPRTQEVPEP